MNLNRPYVCVWRDHMADSDLPSTTKLVLHTVALNFDSSGTGAYPSLDTIARRASIDRSTAIRHLKRGADWLEQRKGRGRGQATEYTAIIPERTISELADEIARRNVSRVPERGNVAFFPGQKTSQGATFVASKKVAPCTQKGGGARPQLDQEMDRKRRAQVTHDQARNVRLDSDGIRVGCFTLPWTSINRLAEACGIAMHEARALAEAEAYEWSANDSAPDRPLAYLRTIFASHRDSYKMAAARIARLATAVPRDSQEQQANGRSTPLSQARQLALAASFFKHGEWSARVRETLGPAPGESGCAIPLHIVQEAREMAADRREHACVREEAL